MSRATKGLVSRLLLQQTRAQRAEAGLLSGSNALIRVVAARGASTEVVGRPSSGVGSSEHTAKWMTNYELKSPQELIAEVPPIEVGARVVACEGGRDPSLGHPVEYICLDLPAPNPCKYCGLRYVQAHKHHH